MIIDHIRKVTIDPYKEKENGCFLMNIRCFFIFYEKMNQRDI